MDTMNTPIWFQKAGERVVSQEILLAKLNPKMDIVALVLDNHDVIMHRIYTWQRVSHIPKPAKGEANEPIKVVGLEWSPDGRFLVLAYNQRVFLKDGIESSIPGEEPKQKAYSLYLYSLELFQYCRPRKHESNITCLHWNVRYATPIEDGKNPEPEELPARNISLGSAHVNLYFHTNLHARPSDVNNPQDIGKRGLFGLISENQNYYTKDGEVIYIDPHQMIRERVASFLFIGHADGRIQVEGQGTGTVLNIVTKEKKPIVSISAAYDFSLLLALAGPPEEQHVLMLPTDLLHDRYAELFEEIRVRHQIYIRLKTIKTLISDMCSKWDDFILDLDSKFAAFELVTGFKKEPEPTARNLLDSPAPIMQRKLSIHPYEFLDLIVYGQVSMNLERFLTDMNRTSGMAKFSCTFEHSFNYIQQLIVNFQAILMQITAYLTTIRGVNCDMEGPYVDTIPYVNHLRREVTLMHAIFGRHLTIISHYLLQMRSLAHLLNRALIMSKSDDSSKETENLLKTAEEDGTMTVTDLNLLTDFLYESAKCGGFRFEKISSFLSRKLRDGAKTANLGNGDECEEDEVPDILNPYGDYLRERQIRSLVSGFNDSQTKGLQDDLVNLFSEHHGTTAHSTDRPKTKCSEETECQAWLDQLVRHGTGLDHLDLNAVSEGWSVHDLYRRVKRSWKLYISKWVAANDREYAKSGQLNYRCVDIDHTGSPRRDLIISRMILRSDLRPRCLMQAEMIDDSTVVIARIPLKPAFDSLNPNNYSLPSYKNDELPEAFYFRVESFRVVALKFYSEELLTLLVEDSETDGSKYNYLVQIPFAQAYPQQYLKRANLLDNWNETGLVFRYTLDPTIDEIPFEVTYRKISSQHYLTTNSSRKLSCCISANRHRVSFFEMDAIEDEEEEEDESRESRIDDSMSVDEPNRDKSDIQQENESR